MGISTRHALLAAVGAGAALLAAVPGQAALHIRGGGTMVYDDVLNVTWAADAGPVFGDVDAARAYAAGLTLGGFSDWRLPSITNVGTSTICFGYGCAQSELGYMHYVNFGTGPNAFTFGGPNAANIALFTNYAGANLFAVAENFTATNAGANPPASCVMTPGLESCTWLFRNDGLNSYGGKVQPFKAWVLRDGDVAGPAVPEPSAWALLILGFGMTGAAMRHRRPATAFA